MKTGLKITVILFTIVSIHFLTKRAVNYINKPFVPDELVAAQNQSVIGTYSNYSTPTSSVTAKDLKLYSYRWHNSDTLQMNKQLSSVLPKGQAVLLTIEMLEKRDADATGTDMLQAVLEGKYDSKIKAMCNALRQHESDVFLRWNPDMEVPSNQYQWQNQAPSLYTQAFRYFAQKCKAYLPEAKIVWGPAGFPGALEYWPGADAVDLMSVSINSASEIYTSVKYPATTSKAELIKRKFHRLRFIQKPVIVVLSKEIRKDAYTEKDVTNAAKMINAFNNDNLVREKRVPNRMKAAMHLTIFKANEKGSESNSKLMIGVYDPLKALTGQKEISIEHIFTNWANIKNGRFERKFREVAFRNHDIIVTMEPWKATKNDKDRAVLAKVIKGKYDKELAELYRIISDTERTVYLRWAHEMEIPIKRYPWQSQDPHLYIKAYRYFVKQKPLQASNIKFVWGPAGDRGSLEWWPGDDVADYISIAIYGLPDKNITDHRQQENFKTILDRKLYRMRFVDKPVFITEFGVKGPEDYQTKWMSEAASTLNKHPEITGICYFNMVDSPKAWGEIDAPKWNISNRTFNSFIKTLERPH